MSTYRNICASTVSLSTIHHCTMNEALCITHTSSSLYFLWLDMVNEHHQQRRYCLKYPSKLMRVYSQVLHPSEGLQDKLLNNDCSLHNAQLERKYDALRKQIDKMVISYVQCMKANETLQLRSFIVSEHTRDLMNTFPSHPHTNQCAPSKMTALGALQHEQFGEHIRGIYGDLVQSSSKNIGKSQQTLVLQTTLLCICTQRIQNALINRCWHLLQAHFQREQTCLCISSTILCCAMVSGINNV